MVMAKDVLVPALSTIEGRRGGVPALALLLLFLFAVPSAQANESEHGEENGRAEGHGHGSHGHEFHRHHLSVFLGGGTRDEHGETENGFAGGLEYEYRFSKWLGAGLLAEAATGDLRDVVVAGLVYIHPWKGLVLSAGPGGEFNDEDEEYLTRLGVSYQFPVANRFTIAPSFNVDIVDGDPTYIYGFAFGIGF